MNLDETKVWPSVGVVIRMFNSEAYLEEAVRSILDQGYDPLQIVAVDGGSTDGTLGILHQTAPTAVIIPQTRPGIGGMAREGVEALDTDLIAFQDSDDVWPAGRLHAMVHDLMEHPHWDGVMGEAVHFLSPDVDPGLRERFRIAEGQQPGFGLASLLVRREVFDRVGPFADGLNAGEYLEWIDRARVSGAVIAPIQVLSLRRRVHLHNHSQSNLAKKEMLRALSMVISRRKQHTK